MSHPAADRYAWIEPDVEDLGAGIHRIPLPLPLDGLKAVNVYAITDPGGVDLIDAGFASVTRSSSSVSARTKGRRSGWKARTAPACTRARISFARSRWGRRLPSERR